MTDPQQESLFDLDDLNEEVEVAETKDDVPNWGSVIDFCEDLLDDTLVDGDPYFGSPGVAGYSPDGGLVPITGSWTGVQGVAFTRDRDTFTAVPIGTDGEPLVSDREIVQDYTFGLTRRGRIVKDDIPRFREMYQKVTEPRFALPRLSEDPSDQKE